MASQGFHASALPHSTCRNSSSNAAAAAGPAASLVLLFWPLPKGEVCTADPLTAAIAAGGLAAVFGPLRRLLLAGLWVLGRGLSVAANPGMVQGMGLLLLLHGWCVDVFVVELFDA